MTPENQIKRAICQWLAAKRAFFWVTDRVGIYDPTRKTFRSNRDPYRIKGVADILGSWKGRLLAIEVKTKTGRISQEQKQFLARVNESGGIGFVARSIDDVERELKRLTAWLQSDDVARGDEKEANSTSAPREASQAKLEHEL